MKFIMEEHTESKFERQVAIQWCGILTNPRFLSGNLYWWHISSSKFRNDYSLCSQKREKDLRHIPCIINETNCPVIHQLFSSNKLSYYDQDHTQSTTCSQKFIIPAREITHVRRLLTRINLPPLVPLDFWNTLIPQF